MWIILFPSNLGMETNCPFAAAVLRVQNVQQPSQCETKPLQTFSYNWIKMLFLPKEALCMSKCGGQPSLVLHQWLHYKTLSCSVRRCNFSDRHHHCIGLPELPLHRAAGCHLRAVCLPIIPHWPHPPNTGLCLKCSQTTANTTICITESIYL